MSIINKEDTLYQRDEDGNIKSIKVHIEKMGGDVIVIPLTRQELNNLWKDLPEKEKTTKDQDAELILKHILEPKFTEDDIKGMKPLVALRLINAIMEASGAIGAVEDESGKNSKSGSS